MAPWLSAIAFTVQAGTLTLSQSDVVDTILKKNPSIKRDQLEIEIVGQSIQSAQAAFDPIFFANTRYTNQYTEKSATSFSLNPDPLDQTTLTAELGLRETTQSGADLTLGLNFSEVRSSEIRTYSPDNAYDTESRGDLAISIRQPLMRGFRATEQNEAIKEARGNTQVREFDLAARQLRSVGEGLRQYWTLYRAHQALKLDQTALNNARDVLATAADLVEAGKRSEIDLLEAEALVLARRSAMAATESEINAAQSELLVTLGERAGKQVEVADLPTVTRPPVIENVSEYARGVLDTWPGYNKAKTQISIEQSRIKRSKDSLLPQLDLLLGYTHKALDKDRGGALDRFYENNYRDWYVGISFEKTLEGNRRAEAIAQAARTRLKQAYLDADQIQRRLIADIEQRLDDTHKAYDEWQLAVDLRSIRARTYRSFKQAFEAGRISVTQLAEIENDLIQATKRMYDQHARYQLTLVSLRLADGTLLARN